MHEATDPNATRPILSAKVLYRCTCGTELQIALEIGGACPRCKRFISPKILQHEMAVSTICDESFELVSIPVKTRSADAPYLNGEADINSAITQERLLPSQQLSGETQRNPDSPHTPLADVMAGKKYGHFELIAPLGRGGMGQVYRALDTSLQRYVAVKLLKSGIPQSEQGSTINSLSPLHEVDKLLQEAITQARVAHPNIVTIYFVGKEAGHPFLAMELVNGKPLNRLIENDSLPFSSIIAVASQIANALKFSYELDLIHGDIKPSNILIQHDGVAKLSDFGMARNASHDTNEAIGGTLNYLAPEILSGSKPSLQSDVYSLGVTFYEMTFGQLPVTFSGNQIAEWVNVHENSRLTFPEPWPERLPEPWREILGKMLVKNPADRYTDYDSLIDDLTRIKPHSLVIARPTPRLVAAGIDWISILAVSILFQVVFSVSTLGPFLANLIRVIDFVPMIIYLIIIYLFRQSLGSSMMHIRVVNKYGHRPKPSQMLARSMLRMQFPWITVGSLVFLNIDSQWLDVSLSVLLILSGIFLVGDIAMMAFNRQRQSLHDRIFGTRVVVDIDASS